MNIHSGSHLLLQSNAKTAKPPATELANPSEPVSFKKNLFEAGDAWTQNSVKVTLSKVNKKSTSINHHH
jgi:hypothetical protein